MNGVTAWQMLFRDAEAKSGQTILVHGAHGGVGTVLCQLARHAGIRVLGTDSPRHHDALRAMGVEPLDYNAPNLSSQIQTLAPLGVDAAFDHLGLESARISYTLRVAVHTDLRGNFVLPLEEGGYDILVTAPGFAAAVQTIPVGAGKTRIVEWQLKALACNFPGMNCDTFQ